MILKRYGKLLAILLAVLAFNLLYFDTGLPVPGTLAFAVSICLSVIFFLLISPSRGRNTLALFAVSIITSFIGMTTAAPIARCFNALVSLGLLTVGIYITLSNTTKIHSLSETILIPFRLSLGWLASLFTTPSKMVPKSSTKSANWSGKITKTSLPLAKIVRGLLLTIPFALIMIVLLSSADPVFSRLVEDLVSFKIPQIPSELVSRFVMTMVFLAIIIPFLFLRLTPPHHSLFPSKTFKGYSTEATVLMSTLSLILGVFLLIQFKYVFSSSAISDLQQFGVTTYSEYVRRGFTELILVTVIVYIASGLSFLISRANRYQYKALTVASFILLGLTALFIFSIFRRVYFYQLEHGLSVARVYGIVFLGFISSVLSVLALRIFNRFKTPWHILEVSLLALFAVLPSILKPDALIAEHNPPTVNRETDYTYIANLSADAVDGWITSYNQVLNWLSLNEGIFEQTEITDEQYRQTSYHLFTVNNLLNEYERLAVLYDDESVSAFFKNTIGTYHSSEHLEFLRKNKLAFYNFSEQHAFSKLHGSISPAEITALQQRLTTFLDKINETQLDSYQFDRSFDTPLVD